MHKTIWKIANELRGAVDGWEFKAYVLGSIFYRFISENICDYIHQLMVAAGQPDFDYTTISDDFAENIRKKMVEEKGYFILPSQLFQNVVKTAEKDENLNERFTNIFHSIEASAIGTPSEEDLRRYHEQSGLPLKRFFNTSGQLYRQLELAKKLPAMPEAEQFKLLASDGMLVKRPLVIAGAKVLTGFKEPEWERVFLNGSR